MTFTGRGEMGFADAVKACFAKYVTFSGRARRAEFWYWILFFYVSATFVGVCAGFSDNFLSGPVFGAYSVFILLPTVSVGVRRLHDTGRSGWWWLVCYVPFGAIFLFAWWMQRGTAGSNRFGADPLAV